MSKIIVLGVELEYDFFDADELEKYQQENQMVVNEINAIDFTKMSPPDGMREQCKIVNTFFDNMFGHGTAERLFHGKSNIKDHLEAFAAVTNAGLSSNAELRSISDRYNPNRAQRRFEQKNANRKNGNKHGSGHHG